MRFLIGKFMHEIGVVLMDYWYWFDRGDIAGGGTVIVLAIERQKKIIEEVARTLPKTYAARRYS
jgi:hypothetical protein